MYFNEGNVDGRERIPDRNTGMRVRGSVDDDVFRSIAPRFLDPIHQSAFMIALVRAQYGSPAVGQVLESLIDIRKSQRAVDLGLACAEQVEIGAVQNQNALRHYGIYVKTDRLFTPKSPVCPLSSPLLDLYTRRPQVAGMPANTASNSLGST